MGTLDSLGNQSRIIKTFNSNQLFSACITFFLWPRGWLNTYVYSKPFLNVQMIRLSTTRAYCFAISEIFASALSDGFSRQFFLSLQAHLARDVEFTDFISAKRYDSTTTCFLDMTINNLMLRAPVMMELWRMIISSFSISTRFTLARDGST